MSDSAPQKRKEALVVVLHTSKIPLDFGPFMSFMHDRFEHVQMAVLAGPTAAYQDQVMPWCEWRVMAQEAENIFRARNADMVPILAGSAPGSLAMEFGIQRRHAVTLACQYPGGWRIFELRPLPETPPPPLMYLTVSCPFDGHVSSDVHDGSQPEKQARCNADQDNTCALFYVTGDAGCGDVCQHRLSRIKAALPEGMVLGAVCVLRPVGTSDVFVRGDPNTADYNYNIIHRDIRDGLLRMHSATKATCGVTVLAAGAAPVSMLVGAEYGFLQLGPYIVMEIGHTSVDRTYSSPCFHEQLGM